MALQLVFPNSVAEFKAVVSEYLYRTQLSNCKHELKANGESAGEVRVGTNGVLRIESGTNLFRSREMVTFSEWISCQKFVWIYSLPEFIA